MRSWRDAEADAARSRFLREEDFQLGAEQMCGETELAALLVKHRHQVIGQHITIRICINFNINFNIKFNTIEH